MSERRKNLEKAFQTSSNSETRLKARAVARGVAVGRVVCLHGRKRQFYRINLQPNQIEKELRRFKASVRLAKRQLKKISGSTNSEPARSNIFETHLLMLDDRSLLEKIEQIITAQKVNAEWAVKIVTENYISAHKAIPDEHLREKYIDLEDIADRLLTALGGGRRSILKLEPNSIIVAKEVNPSTLMELVESHPKAIITEHGGWTSHTFILARELNLPAVTGLKNILRRVQTGDEIIVDGFSGQIVLNPSTETLVKYRRTVSDQISTEQIQTGQVTGKIKTLDGFEVTLRANLDLPEGYVNAKKYGARGIGLYRSEYLFNQYKGFPSETEQIKAYKKIAAPVAPEKVRIRTFDLNLEHLAEQTGQKEKNPALGLRAIRLSLFQKKEFRTQIRALLQASVENPIDIVLPMISDVSEVRQVKDLIEKEKATLRRKKIPFGNPSLGAMIEVPSAVLAAEELALETDFFCLGTNDLVQYLLAVDRDNELVADWFRTLHPAVIKAVGMVLKAARKHQIPVTVCGEMAGSPVYAAILIGLGADELSMNVNSIPRVRQTISGIAFEEAREIVKELAICRTADEVEATVSDKFTQKWSHLFTADILPNARNTAKN